MHSSSMVVEGRELDIRVSPVRAGVIPFTIMDGHLYFLMGIDRRTRELTDFGGGVKSTETMLEGARRECDEESCKIFGNIISRKVLERSPAVTNPSKNTAIFFVRISVEWIEMAERRFRDSHQNLRDYKKHNELIGIKWVVDTDFKKIAYDRGSQCMWRRIQNIFRYNTCWADLRLVLSLGPELLWHDVTTEDSWQLVGSRKGPQLLAATGFSRLTIQGEIY